jgi:hypothetical protein
MKSPEEFMSACLFSLTDRNFFQSGIFLPSMTWNTFVWAVTLVRRSLSADLMEFFPSFLGHTGQIHLLLYVLLQSMLSTVCSTTSSFFGIGKKSVYKILKAPDFRDLDNLGDPEKDVAISCSSRFVARLYDQKKSCASSHHNINKLQVKLATSRDASLVRLPPSEAALRQHILCASLQTKVWHAFCLVKSPI